MHSLRSAVGRIAADPDLDRLTVTVDDWRRRWRDRVVDEERERRDPWALPLVVRVERAAPPTHDAALCAAALSVAAILTRPGVAPAQSDLAAADTPGVTGTTWHAALARWAEGRIRKVVRRARGARWQDIADLPGVTASVDDAQVRALLPHPVADPPPALARLQIVGLDLSNAGSPHYDDAAVAAPVLTIMTAPDLALTTGKACAQVGHAAQLALLELDRETVLAWTAAGHALRVVEASAEEWDELRHADSGVALVHDGGFTEVAPGTLTCGATFDRIGQPRLRVS